MNKRHIHEATLRLRQTNPGSHARGGGALDARGGGKAWANSPIARAVADQEKATPARSLVASVAPTAIHRGWFREVAAD